MNAKLREQAAVLCSAMATRWELGYDSLDIDQVDESIGAHAGRVKAIAQRASDVAAATLAAPRTRKFDGRPDRPSATFRRTWALAESLIRTGWSPS